MSEYDNSKLKYDLRREFGDGRGNNFDPSWKEKAFRDILSDSEVGFARFGVYELVGNGDVTDESCGKFKRFNGCLRVKLHNLVNTTLDGKSYVNKGYVKPVWWSCHRPTCPVCYKKGWAVREANSIEARLRAGSLKFGKIEHIIASVPSCEHGLTLEVLRLKCVKILAKRGVVGGTLIFHSFRYRNRDMFKDGVRYPMGWYWSPHFHILGFIRGGYGKCRSCKFQLDGTFIECRGCDGFEGVTRRAYEKDGWIVKVKGERKTVGGTAWYQLNHASVKRGVKRFHVATWFGICSYRKLKIMKSDKDLRNLCPICGESLYKVRFNGDFAKFMSEDRPKGGFVVDVKDNEGNMLWECVHNERG